MSRLEILDTVLVLDSCPLALYRGKTGKIVDGAKWGMRRVEIVIDGVVHKPLIAAGHLRRVVPESESSA